jgi:hypothetical protein
MWEIPVDQELLTGFVRGLIGLFAACLFILVIALSLRDLVRWRSKAGTSGKQVAKAGLTKAGVTKTERRPTIEAAATLAPGKRREAAFGISPRDQESRNAPLPRNRAEP